ncbi:hypothetical protein Tco_1000759, partial [Tanacetum coccineum]
GLASSGYLLAIADNGEMCELHPDGYRRNEIIVAVRANSFKRFKMPKGVLQIVSIIHPGRPRARNQNYMDHHIMNDGYVGGHFFRKMVADSNAPVQDRALQREFPPCPSPPPAPYSFPLIKIRHGQVLGVDGEIAIVQ